MKIQGRFSKVHPEHNEHTMPAQVVGSQEAPSSAGVRPDNPASSASGELAAKGGGLLDRRYRPNPALPDPLIDVRGAATTLGVSVRTIYALMAKGMLPPVQVLGRTLFDPADIRTFIERAKRHGSAKTEGGAA